MAMPTLQTRNLCEVPQETLAEETNLIVEAGGYLQRVPQTEITGQIEDVRQLVGETRAEIETEMGTRLDTKVDKVDGKGLSANDYTDGEKAKLAGVEEGANKTIVDSALSEASANPVQNQTVTAALGEKVPVTRAVNGKALAGNITLTAADVEAIPADQKGAVGGVAELDGEGKVPAAQLPPQTQADWTENDLGSAAYIKNKPFALQADGGDSDTVNGHTVETDVPPDAVFTDTVYVHPETHPAEMITQGATHRFVSDEEKGTWNAKAEAAVATTTADGLMSNMDKGKLDGIEAGANKTIVDSELSQASSNPVQNRAVYAALSVKAPTEHTHTKSQITDFPVNIPASGGNSDTVNGHTVETDVPAGAKFTDTVYTHPTTHPATMIIQDATHRFVTDTEKTNWNNKAPKDSPVFTNSISMGRTGTVGENSVAVGRLVSATGTYSHAEGYESIASGDYSHAEGSYTTAYGKNSHAEGSYSKAFGDYSHAEGMGCLAGCRSLYGDITFSSYELVQTASTSYTCWLYSCLGEIAFPSDKNELIGKYIYIQSDGILSSKASSIIDAVKNSDSTYNIAFITNRKDKPLSPFKIIAESYWTDFSHAEGFNTKATGVASHAEGHQTTASGNYSHAEGYESIASGDYSHAEGKATTASNYASHSMGTYNRPMDSFSSRLADVLVIGNGTSASSLSNAFRVTYAGAVYGLSNFNSTGADYAEFFEWQDGNPDTEDRVGYFVTLDGNKIRLASSGDYLLGIVSGQPCIIGNADEDWLGRWEHDEFGRFVKEEVDTPITRLEVVEAPVLDADGNLTGETRPERTEVETGEINHGWRYKANPDYDASQPYIERKDRPEWSAVGMLGVLSVRDNGQCTMNGFCTCGEGGIAVPTEDQKNGYRVIKRMTDSVIQVVFR